MDGLRAPALLGAVLLVVVGCAQSREEPGSGPTGADGDVSPPATHTLVPPPTTGTTPATSSTRPATVLRGRVVDGVEAGCVVLSTERGQFLLLGGDEEVLRAGAEVVVEGTIRLGQATTCQQGTPFAVAEARTAPTR